MKDKLQSKVVKKLNYFDYAATAPMRDEALEVYSEFAKMNFGNTQSLHDVGTRAAQVVAACQQFWGRQLGGDSSGVFFTGNASEANQLAIRGFVKGKSGKILACPLEHASVLTMLGELQAEGFEIEWMKLTPSGEVDLEAVARQIDSSCLLMICQWVNSETGIIQPVEQLVKLAATYKIPLHCDAVQGFGKCSLEKWTSEVASFVVSGHKFGGPKGCGVVWMNPAYHWQSVYSGTTHQQGFRAGTLDVAAIAATTRAAELALLEQKALYQRVKELHDVIHKSLPDEIEVVGSRTKKSPFILGVLGFGVDGQHTMLEGNRRGFAFSTGSACKVGHGEAMSTLTSLKYSQDEAKQFVRFSFGHQTTQEQVNQLTQWLQQRRTP